MHHAIGLLLTGAHEPTFRQGTPAGECSKAEGLFIGAYSRKRITPIKVQLLLMGSFHCNATKLPYLGTVFSVFHPGPGNTCNVLEGLSTSTVDVIATMMDVSQDCANIAMTATTFLPGCEAF